MNEIYLYDTLTKTRKKFEPIEAGKVSMYNCGPTVYNHAHIGNLRSYVFADILRRMFEWNGYEVKQIMNITDIGHLASDSDIGEDKMMKALKREGKPLTLKAMREVADFYFQKFKNDFEELNIEMPHKFPFASEHIAEDISLIEKLSENGFTYKTSDGIYFDTGKFADYGKMGSNAHVDENRSRIGENLEKKNPRDFAVWKFNAELGYDAPFGKGFPGWHIECSAMSVKYLGPEFDIHTGGIDHIPVHHNNEMAQAICAGYPYARIWMHNAFLTVADKSGDGKMSKSDENFITLQTLKEKNIDPLAYRYLLLTAQYSSPLQFSWEALEGAQTAWQKIKNFLQNIKNDIENSFEEECKEKYRKTFVEHINNNLDTPKALALVWEILKDENLSDQNKKSLILDFDKVLGLQLNVSRTVLDIEIPEEVRNLIKERDTARLAKDFAKSDELREKIELLGFVLKDTETGTSVDKKA